MESGSYKKNSLNFERIICIDNKSDFFSISNEINSTDIVLAIDQDVIELHNYLHNTELPYTNNDMTIGDINTMKNYFVETIPVNLIVNKLINSCNN